MWLYQIRWNRILKCVLYNKLLSQAVLIDEFQNRYKDQGRDFIGNLALIVIEKLYTNRVQQSYKEFYDRNKNFVDLEIRKAKKSEIIRKRHALHLELMKYYFGKNVQNLPDDYPIKSELLNDKIRTLSRKEFVKQRKLLLKELREKTGDHWKKKKLEKEAKQLGGKEMLIPQLTTENENSKYKSYASEIFQFFRLPDLITILSVFVLIPGFIIVNVYLADFGIYDYSLFRMKYLSAGFLFIMILAVYFFFVWRKIYYAEEDVGEIARILMTGSISKFGRSFWGFLAMIIVYADNAFGIVVATTLISMLAFPYINIGLVFGFLFLFFIIDYPMIKLNIYQKSPRVMFITSCIFHILSVFLFFAFIKEGEARMLFWTLVAITFIINSILDLRKKQQPEGSYVTKLSTFDFIWIMICVIGLSVYFGKTLYGKISPELGGGKPKTISLIIEKKDMSFFKKISIEINNNISEDLFLLQQTNNEIYIVSKKSIDEKNKNAIQLNKNLIQGIIYHK
jgi:hypothetical protein